MNGKIVSMVNVCRERADGERQPQVHLAYMPEDLNLDVSQQGGEQL
jgi:hypothetical protein